MHYQIIIIFQFALKHVLYYRHVPWIYSLLVVSFTMSFQTVIILLGMHWEDKEILSAENSGNTLHAVKLKDAPLPQTVWIHKFSWQWRCGSRSSRLWCCVVVTKVLEEHTAPIFRLEVFCHEDKAVCLSTILETTYRTTASKPRRLQSIFFD